MWSQLILAVFSLILGILGTVSVQYVHENKIKQALHQELFAEIKHNTRVATTESAVPAQKFQVGAWENFIGTAAFHDLPANVRRSLDNYYVILKSFNEDLFKARARIKNKDLVRFILPYQEFLLGKDPRMSHGIFIVPPSGNSDS